MLDLKFFRENTDLIKTAVARKKFSVDFDELLALDSRRREVIREAEEARAGQKSANTRMAKLDKKSPEFQQALMEMRELAQRVKQLQTEQAEVENRWDAAYMAVPNLPDASVPSGHTEADNVTVLEDGDMGCISDHAMPHYDIPWFTKLVDLERGTKVTGAGFPFYRGPMARLVRSLVQFFINENAKAGFEEMHAPLMVNAASATATGQLPDKEGQMYFINGDGFYMIPTAEVPVTNYFRDEMLDPAQLPLRICAYTPCFRREAGSYGKDVRGLNRLHQFDKVELVEWVHPDDGLTELENLRTHIEGLIRQLGLPFRTLLMCAGDIGFPHAKQYDMEVWSGGQKRWLEVSSASCFTDFQARRANIRFRDETGKPRHVHTLNGSGLALPRILAALLENNYQVDGTVKLPEVLVPYFGDTHLRPQ